MLVLLVTFDLWVSLVSVFLCLFSDLVVFCSGLLGRGRGAGVPGGDPLQQLGGGLCPPAQPPRLTPLSPGF